MKKLAVIIGAILIVLAFSNFTSFNAGGEDGDAIVGLWEPSNGKVRIKIERIGTKYYGKIVWLREPIDPVTKKPKTDKNNEDEKMRNVPLRGYRLLKDFTYKGKDKWEDGTIYDPESGSLYSCVISKDKDVLNIRGYVGVKALGRTDTWKRVELKKKK
jgi:uncharacterized protein (DUF2147 family)